jgi:hypothetical protein
MIPTAASRATTTASDIHLMATAWLFRPRFHWRAAALCVLLLMAGLATIHAQVVISEFVASNSRSLADQDGDYSDWIELYNAGAESVNLSGWYLTDDAAELAKYRFPSVTLRPNRYLIVFASDKNRAAAGQELHANFKLSSGGDYLALVKPDGTTITSAHAPLFPSQVTDVSYGIPMQQTVTTLLDSGAPAKLRVPANDALGTGWTDSDWPDSDWINVTAGIGFETGNPTPISVVIADSAAEFSGVQGQNNWFYGYYNRTTDAGSVYQMEDFVPFPRSDGPHSATNAWNGTSWDWFNGDPPWVEIGQRYTHPNGVNNTSEIWAIRRWVSPVSGTLTVRWQLAKQNANGNGVTGRVLYQGNQRDVAVVAGRDVIGTNRTTVLPNVLAGDRIDLALSPIGVSSATDDSSDGSYMSATISVTNSLASQIKTNIATSMHGLNATAYLRIPFMAADPSRFEFLTLRMKYNDGFIAYLNGVEVARRNAPDVPAWNSSATAARSVADAVQFEEIDLSKRIGLLHAGTNVLALHGLNASAADADFLMLPELTATSLTLDAASRRYFSLPTPGAVNGLGKTNLGPLLVDIAHTPRVPTDDQDIVITARAVRTFDPIARVTLSYRVMYTNELSVPMLDDGLHGDGAANDGVYGATIPASVSSSGQMVRYALTAVDSTGDSSRWPPYPDPKNSPQYFGTMVADPNVSSPLPVLYWFIQSRTAADSETGTRSSVFYAGEFYDNILVKLHGQSSATFPKKSYDFDFNRGSHFRYSPDQKPVEDFNLLTTYPDKAHMRNLLAYETYRDAGAGYHVTFPLRVQQNGAFFSDAHFCEDGNEDYLSRLGLDPNGALYKMYNIMDSATTGAEKKTRKNEGNADLQALITGLRLTGAARTQFIYNNIDIPALVNFLTAMIITGGTDCCHKNYYAYRDTEGSGLWRYLPWDVDLTFGRNWNSANTYFDDTMFTGNALFIGSNNNLVSALIGTPAIRQMYLARLRTLMDELLQSTNTPPAQRKYERRIDELAAVIGPDAALDYAKWATWGQKQTLPQAIAILTNVYFPGRRSYLYRLTEIPKPQPTNATLVFGTNDFNPTSGNQDEEYIQIRNTNTVSLDLSGWKVAGEISHAFQPGTVLPTNSSIYLSPNVAAFRTRMAAPTGNQGLFVQGNYRGQLSARGGAVRVLDNTGREAASFTYPGAPTLAQQGLRIVELMYHPAPGPASSPFPSEDFEYIQLKNIGTKALDLNGVRFATGITFSFTGSGVNLLQPGETVYVAKNPAAFAARYGQGFNVAGPYEGNLENKGENIKLIDSVGENVLDFGYDNTWYPSTDGTGFSLMIVDEAAPWDTWGDKVRWRVSPVANGSPALGSSVLAAWKVSHFTTAELANAKVSGNEADADQDGRSNLDEFISGTDPRNPASYLKIDATVFATGGQGAVTIRFNAIGGKSYTVQYADSLAKPVWLKLLDVPAQTATRAVDASDSGALSRKNRYYRVVTPMQP